MAHLLEPVGLGRDDNDVYLALVVRPSASIAVLAEATALPVAVIGAALARLADTGLVVRDEFAAPRYRAISPDEAGDGADQDERGHEGSRGTDGGYAEVARSLATSS